MMLKAWLQTAARQPLAGFLALFLAASFFIPSQPAWALLFYVVGLPLTIWRLIKGADINWRSPQIVLVGLMIGFSALSMAWGWRESPSATRSFGQLLSAACTAAFFLGLLASLKDNRDLARTLGWIFIIGGAINVLIGFALNFAAYRTDFDRFDGWAITKHQILGSMVLGQCYLFALDRCLREPRWRIAAAVSAVLCLAFIIMTGSRGPLVAAIIASPLLLIGLSKRSGLVLLLAPILCAVVAAGLFCFKPHLFQLMIDELWGRGDSYRPRIWSFALQRVAEHPWFGHGPAAELAMPRIRPGLEIYNHPHNFYLAALFYGGVTGLVLLLAVVGYTSVKLIRPTVRSGSPIVLAMWVSALIGGLTDMAQVTDGPVHIWLIFWVPLIMASRMILDDEDGHLPAEAAGGAR